MWKNNKFIIDIQGHPYDIQGSMYSLCDPEIATSELFDGEGTVYFCSGNLSEHAIPNFVKEQVCRVYCVMLALGTLLSWNDDTNANLVGDGDKKICVKE